MTSADVSSELARQYRAHGIDGSGVRSIDIEGGDVVVTTRTGNRRVLVGAPRWLVDALQRDTCRVKA